MFDVVTGGCGFIGSHLVERLLFNGRQVVVIDKPHCIISNYLDFKNAGRIFHLAGKADIVPSISNPAEYFHTNVTGTLNVLEAARKAGVKKFVYAASASCYGDTLTIDASESHPCNPVYPYALTKYLGEQLVMHWSKIYKIPAVSLRLFNVYGLRSRTNGAYGAMFGTFLAQIANHEPVTIVGDGEQTRDFVHVSDVVEAILTDLPDGIYNVGTGRETSINRIVELLGTKEVAHLPKRPGEPDAICADIRKINKYWQPKVSIEDGVKELLEHISEWKDAPLWTKDRIADATREWFECLR